MILVVIIILGKQIVYSLKNVDEESRLIFSLAENGDYRLEIS